MENDSSYEGTGYILNSETGDRFNSQELSLNRRRGKWIYSAKTNSANWTEFPATQVSEKMLIFENPAHNSPQFIQYELIAPDSLLVTIGDSTSSKNWKMFKVD
ncbi:MAG: hypothetical protein GY751_10140 [Bacteroidetes bacterium]|nr:hypothetical protein [Bacteroidota bacterium]